MKKKYRPRTIKGVVKKMREYAADIANLADQLDAAQESLKPSEYEFSQLVGGVIDLDDAYWAFALVIDPVMRARARGTAADDND